MAKRRKRNKAQKFARYSNRHHLIFQRRHYADGYGYLLRQAFIYEIPVKKHDGLHKVLHDIPKPPEDQLKRAYERYLNQKSYIDTLDICEALEWLIWACEDEAWRACMRKQLDYFRA